MFKKNHLRCSLIVLLLVLSMLLSGCTPFWRSETESTESSSLMKVPDLDLTTTQVGAATGAVLGAGVGAVIGSSTGNAGEGLVLGSLAGAAAGGLVGREFEKQEAQTAETEELLERHDEMIHQQRRELEYLKRQSSDEVLDNTNSQTRRNRQTTLETANPRRSNLPRSARSQTSSTVASDREYLTSPSRYSRSRSSQPVESSSYQNKNVSSLSPEFEDSFDTSDRNSQLQPRLPKVSKPERVSRSNYSSRASLSASKPALPPAKKTLEAFDIEPPKKPVRSAAVLPSGPQNVASKETLSANCRAAGEEVSYIKPTTSDSDKLFHLRRALRLCPDRAQYHVEIGKVYAKIGREEDAQYEFNLALDLDKTNADAREYLSRLESGSSLPLVPSPANDRALLSNDF